MAFPALTRMRGSSRFGTEKSGYCEGSRVTWRSLVGRVPAHGGPVLEYDRYRSPPATPYERLIGEGPPGRPLIQSSLFALRDRLIFVERVLAAVPRPRALIESLGDGQRVNRLQVYIQYHQVIARLQSTPGGAIDRRHIAGAVEHTANLNDDMRRLDLADEQETIFPDQRSITVHADSSPSAMDLVDKGDLSLPIRRCCPLGRKVDLVALHMSACYSQNSMWPISQHLHIGIVVRQVLRVYRSIGTGCQWNMVWRVRLRRSSSLNGDPSARHGLASSLLQDGVQIL
jgi:hypothetical protein